MKTPASAKRARLPRQFDYAPQFEKDGDRLSRSGRFDMPRLKQVMLLLIANDAPLAAEWKDHALKGQWADCRDCHVHGDFLLLYRIEGGDGHIHPSGNACGSIPLNVDTAQRPEKARADRRRAFATERSCPGLDALACLLLQATRQRRLALEPS